jgi:hypothetical protein
VHILHLLEFTFKEFIHKTLQHQTRLRHDTYIHRGKREETNMSSEIINTTCPCCNKPMDYYKQELHPKSTHVAQWIGTCRTVGCDFELVTLSDDAWTRIQTDETFASGYRGMQARIRTQMAGR